MRIVGYDSDSCEYVARKRTKTKMVNRKGKRLLLFEKYEGVCQLCLQPIKNANYVSIDHIHPRSKGGKNHIDNLQPTHSTCNHIKGADEQQPADYYRNHSLYGKAPKAKKTNKLGPLSEHKIYEGSYKIPEHAKQDYK